jgi:hypothetical protein
MEFNCKFDSRRKGRLLAGGNHTVVTSEQLYSSVVGIETVRAILALSAMIPDLNSHDALLRSHNSMVTPATSLPFLPTNKLFN